MRAGCRGGGGSVLTTELSVRHGLLIDAEQTKATRKLQGQEQRRGKCTDVVFRFEFVWPELESLNARARLGALYFPGRIPPPTTTFLRKIFLAYFFFLPHLAVCLKTSTFLGMDLILVHPEVGL